MIFGDVEFKTKLKFVQISFQSSTFDRIHKARSRCVRSVLMYSAGQSCHLCQPAVCYRRHHGAPYRLLSHQCGGDHILHGQDHLEICQE